MVQYGTYAVPRADLGAALLEYSPARRSDYAAAKMLPQIKVAKVAATLSVITRESLLRRADTRRSGSGYNRVDMYAEDLAYACAEHGLEGVLGDDQRRIFSADFDAEMVTVDHIWLKLLNEAEIRAKDLLWNTTTWTGATLYTDNSADPWDSAAAAIIAQVVAAKEKVRRLTGLMPDTLFCSIVQMQNMLSNTGIIARFPGAPIVTEEMIRNSLAAIFGLRKLVVGGGVYDASLEGGTSSITDIWSDDYAMVALTANENDPPTVPCVGRSILYAVDSPEDPVVEQYREEQSRGDVFRVRHYKQEKVFDASFAHLMKVDA